MGYNVVDYANAGFITDSEAAEYEEGGGRMPCPACPDGAVWNSEGPTSATCPVCKGHAVVMLNGAPINGLR